MLAGGDLGVLRLPRWFPFAVAWPSFSRARTVASAAVGGSEGRSLTRTDRQLRVVALISGAGLLSAVVYQSLRPLSLGGDSGALVRGARGIVDCVRRSRFMHCERFVVHQPTGAHAVIVGQFALLQYVPAIALRAVDVSVASNASACSFS